MRVFLFFTVFDAIAELEYILDCQREGIAIAKVQGEYRGKPKNRLISGFGMSDMSSGKKWDYCCGVYEQS